MKRYSAEYSFYRFKEPVAAPVASGAVTGKAVAVPLNFHHANA